MTPEARGKSPDYSTSRPTSPSKLLLIGPCVAVGLALPDKDHAPTEAQPSDSSRELVVASRACLHFLVRQTRGFHASRVDLASLELTLESGIREFTKRRYWPVGKTM